VNRWRKSYTRVPIEQGLVLKSTKETKISFLIGRNGIGLIKNMEWKWRIFFSNSLKRAVWMDRQLKILIFNPQHKIPVYSSKEGRVSTVIHEYSHLEASSTSYFYAWRIPVAICSSRFGLLISNPLTGGLLEVNRKKFHNPFCFLSKRRATSRSTGHTIPRSRSMFTFNTFLRTKEKRVTIEPSYSLETIIN